MLKQCLRCKKEFEGNRKSIFCHLCSETKQKPLPKQETTEIQPKTEKQKEVVKEKTKPEKAVKTDVAKIVNYDAPKTKQMREPEKGTNAYYLRYGTWE